MFYLHGIKSLNFQGHILQYEHIGLFLSLPQPHNKSSVAKALTGLESELVSRVPFPCWSSQASLVRISCCNPSVHWIWGPHGSGPYQWHKEAGTRAPMSQEPREQQERKLHSLGDFVFPDFHGLSVAMPILANSWFSRLDWQASTFLMSPQLYWACVYFPFVGPLPSVICREWASVSLGSAKFQLPSPHVMWWSCPHYMPMMTGLAIALFLLWITRSLPWNQLQVCNIKIHKEAAMISR